MITGLITPPWVSLPGRGDPAVLLPRPSATAGPVPRREARRASENVVVAEAVECRLQVRVEYPHLRASWRVSEVCDDPITHQPRPGRKPYDLGSNRASHSGSSAFRDRA